MRGVSYDRQFIYREVLEREPFLFSESLSSFALKNKKFRVC